MAYYPLYHLSTHYHGYCVLNTPTTLYTTSPLITMVTVCSILLLPSIPPLHSLPWLLCAQYSYYPLYHLSTHYHGCCVLNTPTTLYTTSPLITMVTVCSILQLPSIPPLHSLPWLLCAQYSYYPLYHLSTHYHGWLLCAQYSYYPLYHLSTHYHGYCVLNTPTTLYTTSPLITMVTVCSILLLPSIPPLHSLPWIVTVCSILLLPSIPPLHSLPWLLCAQYSNYPLYHLSTHYHGYCVLNTPTTVYTTSPLITMVTACSILQLPSIPPLHSLPWLLCAQYSNYPLYHLSTHYHGYCVLNTPTFNAYEF